MKGEKLGMVRLIAAVMLALVGFAAYGNDERSIPTLRQLAQREQADSCGSYRRVAASATAQMANYKKVYGAVVELLKQRRAELDKCGREKGIQVVETEEQDELLAEVCAAAYQAWITPGYRLEMLREDMQSTSDSLKLLNAVLSRRCAEARPTLVKTSQ